MELSVAPPDDAESEASIHLAIGAPQAPGAFPHWRYETLDIDYDAATRAVWMSYSADSPNSYTSKMLLEIANLRESLRLYFSSGAFSRKPVRYFVMASKKPDVFSFGGDLSAFASAIANRDLRRLYEYGRVAIDVIYGLTISFGLPIVTVSAVRGKCLGGGLEGALTTDYLIAEEDAKLGVPEVAFNSFPGMGAVSLLNRRVGAPGMEAIVVSGQIYSAREMFERGVVSVVAPPGRLEETTRAWLSDGGEERFRTRLTIAEARRKFFPITKQELTRVVDLWAECSHAITPRDLRYMERLVAAQKRKSSAGETDGEPVGGG